MQQDSQMGGVQQFSTALTLRPGNSQALVLSSSSGGGEVAILDEADVSRAEHQLRQKVTMHASLFTAPPLPTVYKPSLEWDITYHDQSEGRSQAEGVACLDPC